MEKSKQRKKLVETAVIFKRKTATNGTIIFIPISLRLGYFDKETNLFVTKTGEKYKYMLNEDSIYGFGMRSTITIIKEVYKIENLKQLAQNYFNDIKQFKYYFFIQQNQLSLRAEDKKTKYIYQIEDQDIELGVDTLAEVIDALQSKPIQLDFDTKTLSDGIKSTVIGQDNAIDDIVTIIWQNFRSENGKSNILLVGPSGVGKTEIIRNISKRLDVPMAEVNAASLTQTGYAGESVDTAIHKLVKAANYDVQKASRGIVFIDEIDKKAGDGAYYTGIVSTGVQNELLRLLEDGEYTINIPSEDGLSVQTYTINTKNITFICAGAFTNIKQIRKERTKANIGFSTLTNTTNSISKNNLDYSNPLTSDDFVKYGLKNELVGRLNNFIELNALDKEALIKIMKNPNNTTIQEKINILNKLNIEVLINEDVYDLLADNALKNDTGARGLVSEVDKLFIKAMKEISQNQDAYSQLIITKETVQNPKKYTLVKKKENK